MYIHSNYTSTSSPDWDVCKKYVYVYSTEHAIAFFAHTL